MVSVPTSSTSPFRLRPLSVRYTITVPKSTIPLVVFTLHRKCSPTFGHGWLYLTVYCPCPSDKALSTRGDTFHPSSVATWPR